MQPARVVLDTNIWLDWLVFDDPAVGPLREAQALGRIEIVIDDACETELARVLAYDLGAHTLDVPAQSACLSRCRDIVTRVPTPAGRAPASCRDPDDQKFVDLAVAAGASILVTKDHALLEMTRRLATVRVVAPGEFEVSA